LTAAPASDHLVGTVARSKGALILDMNAEQAIKHEPADASTAWLSLHARMDGRIKIFVAPSCKESANRIELSTGTRLADICETTDLVHGAAYEEGARLPCEPWRRPTEEEAESLIVADVPRNMASSVAIVKLPGGSHQRRQY
jgi:hypothetical protein